jgi:hypothetical protein
VLLVAVVALGAPSSPAPFSTKSTTPWRRSRSRAPWCSLA